MNVRVSFNIMTMQCMIIILLSMSSTPIMTNAFLQPINSNSNSMIPKGTSGTPSTNTNTQLHEMKRPILDQVASTLFKLETDRVQSSSVIDSKGRTGEPMEWSEKDSMANQFSEVIASNPIGYKFKQFVADIVAGEYDEDEVSNLIQEFVNVNANVNANTNEVDSFGSLWNKIMNPKKQEQQEDVQVAMFSFTSCPFCRQAKDYLEENNISYKALELDELDGNRGNEIRAVLGKMTKRTSVPSIFINGAAIGGLNDGTPGLLSLAESGELKALLR